jgi:hypothetical protein
VTAPACPDCGAAMQHIANKWRCPWASTERWEKAFGGRGPVTCKWPLDERREIEGLPNGVTE